MRREPNTAQVTSALPETDGSPRSPLHLKPGTPRVRSEDAVGTLWERSAWGQATVEPGRGPHGRVVDLEEVGGLHVIVALLPSNLRVELQAVGRTARMGNKGGIGVSLKLGGSKVCFVTAHLTRLVCRIKQLVRKYFSTRIE